MIKTKIYENPQTKKHIYNDQATGNGLEQKIKLFFYSCKWIKYIGILNLKQKSSYYKLKAV